MPKKGRPAEPGFMSCAPGRVVIMIPPVSVCHQVSTIGQCLVADGAPVPEPGLGIDRLADRAEQADRGAVVLLHRRLALAHQRADRGRGGVEDVDPVALDHVPEAADIGIVGDAFEHQAGRAVGERAVDDIGVAGDPADVGGAPEKLAGPIVEHIMEGGGRPHRIAAGRVQHALGLAGRSRRVEDEQRVLGVHRLARAVVRARWRRARDTNGRGPPASRSRCRGGGRRSRRRPSAPLASAASTLALSGTSLPPRLPPSAVTTKRLAQSSIRPCSASGEKPPKTTLWTAPIRAQASIATAASGIIGM